MVAWRIVRAAAGVIGGAWTVISIGIESLQGAFKTHGDESTDQPADFQVEGRRSRGGTGGGPEIRIAGRCGGIHCIRGVRHSATVIGRLLNHAADQRRRPVRLALGRHVAGGPGTTRAAATRTMGARPADFGICILVGHLAAATVPFTTDGGGKSGHHRLGQHDGDHHHPKDANDRNR